MRLVVRFPDFADAYDGGRMRAMVRYLEQLFAKVTVDTTRAAYTATASLTLSDEDEVVLMDTSSASLVVTLPEISDDMIRAKREFEVVKTSAANSLTITPGGTDTLVGETDARVTAQWTALRFRATSGNWVLI